MAKSEGYWAIRTYEAGRIGEKIKYWVPGKKPTRSQRRLKSDLAKIKRNDADAVRRVARLINANFPGDQGLLVRLSYSEEQHCALLEEAIREQQARTAQVTDGDRPHSSSAPCGGTFSPGEGSADVPLEGEIATPVCGLVRNDNSCAGAEEEGKELRDIIWELAHHQLQNFLRRLRRACQAAGIECKVLAFTSDCDADGNPVRVHHHLILSPQVRELIEKGVQKEGRKTRRLWTEGQTHCKTLWNEVDHTGLAAYLMGQVRRIGEGKKYVPSRNLVIPQPKDRIAPSGNEVQPPRGARILHRAEYGPGRPMYIRYVIPEKTPKEPARRWDGGGMPS